MSDTEYMTMNDESPKDVTPKKDNKNKKVLAKQIGISLASGAVGAALVLGGYTIATGSNLSNSSSGSATISNAKGATNISNVKANVSTDTTEVVEKVQSAVVSVVNLQQVNKNQSQSGLDGLEGLFGDTYGDNNNQTDSSDSELTTYSEGSGVIYKNEDGKAYIVTNNHVISGASAVEVILSDGTKLEAKVVGADEYSDIAVLSIDGSKVDTTAEFGHSDTVKVGETAIAIGSPLGTSYSSSVTQGIISATNRSIEVPISDNSSETKILTALQTDAAINPGNSGGPLINLAGQIIGINSIKLASSTSGTSVEGMGFAIPSNDVVNIVNQLVEKGKVVRPYLGARMTDLTNLRSSQQATLNLPSSVKEGVVLASVESGSPASKGGLKAGDTIVEIDGKEITSYAVLRSELYTHAVGDEISIKVYRDGKEKTVKVTLGENTTQAAATTTSS